MTLVGWFSKLGNRIARIELADGRYLPENKVEPLLAVMSRMNRFASKRKAEDQVRLDAVIGEAWVIP